MATDPSKASMTEVRQYFESGSRKVEGTELMALKKDGSYDAVARGIKDGTLTY